MKYKLFILIFMCISLVTLVGGFSYEADSYLNVELVLDETENYEADSYLDVTLVLFEVTDSCSPPAINNDWNISLEDSCIIVDDADLGTGKLFFSLTGNATINAIIDTTDIGEVPSGGTVYIDTDGRINTA